MSNDTSIPKPTLPSRMRAFGAHLLTMPRWQKTLLTLATLLFGAGSIGQISGYFSGPAHTQSVSSREDAQKTLVQSESDARPKQVQDSQSTLQKLSPKATKLGLSFIVGFVLGWIFRAFLKLTALIIGGGIALIAGVSYFFNIDLSGVQKQSESFLSWLTTQGQHVLDTILSHLPSSMSSGAGLFVGFRRK